MNPITLAMRRPWTVIVALVAILLSGFLALRPKAFDAWLARTGIAGRVGQFSLGRRVFPAKDRRARSSRPFPCGPGRAQRVPARRGRDLLGIGAGRAAGSGRRETFQHTQQLAGLTDVYARAGQGLKADQQRMEAELAIRRSELLQVEEAVRVASAQLTRLLGGDPLLRVATAEQAVVPLELTAADMPAVDLVEQGLCRRPELAESRHLVAERGGRLQHRPVPAVVGRGVVLRARGRDAG